MRSLLPALLLGIWSASSPRSHAETQSARIDRLFVILDAFNAEVDNQIAIARADLQTTRNEDAWTPELRDAAGAWLDTLVQTGVYTAVRTKTSPNSEITEYRAIAPHKLPPPANRFGDEVTARLRSVEGLRRKATSNLQDEVKEIVDPIWVDARLPEDLQPIRFMLARLKAEVIDKLPQIRPGSSIAPFPNPSFVNGNTRVVNPGEDVRGLALLLLPPDPLVFPDPETDPLNYVRVRRMWRDLGAWNLSAVMGSRIYNIVYEHDRRFRRAALAAQRTLDGLILRRATAQELSKAADWLETFRTASPQLPGKQFPRIPTAAPVTPRPVKPPAGADNPPETITDYHELLTRSPSASGSSSYQQEFYPPITPEVLDEYQAIVALLTARAAAEPPDLAPLQKAVGAHLRLLSPQLQVFLDTTLLPPPAPKEVKNPAFALPTPPAGATPGAVLIAYLDAAAEQKYDRNAAAIARQLLETWRSPATMADTKTILERGLTSVPWQNLATMPGSGLIFAARDGAARERLTQICGTLNADALPVVLREQLEKAIAAGDWPRCVKLLEVDTLAAILPEKEHVDWCQTVALLKDAATQIAGKRPAEARILFQTVLRSPVSAAAGEAAAGSLKALPAAP
ncbi:MAG: hypothetical protein ACAI37_01410 [Chthoniobacter sp.]